MKRILITVLVFITCVFFWGCSAEDGQLEKVTDKPASGEENVFENYNYAEKIPKLFVEYGDKKVQAVMGTSSWDITTGETGKGIESDSGPPEELVTYQKQMLIIDKDGQIHLVFNRQPLEYEARIWNEKDYDSSSVISVHNDYINIAKDQQCTIYEVTARFEFCDSLKEAGIVHYAFVINNAK